MTSFSLSLEGTGEPTRLGFCNGPSDDAVQGPEVNMDGLSMSYDKTVQIKGVGVDPLDSNGIPTITIYDLPDTLMHGNIYGIAFNAEDNAVYSLKARSEKRRRRSDREAGYVKDRHWRRANG